MFHLKWDTTCPRLTHAGLGKEVYASQTKILERVTKDEMRVLGALEKGLEYSIRATKTFHAD